jgi:hypothetical protein
MADDPRQLPPVRKRTRKMRAYNVGYGKPPEHSRFKPGQSGNPKGRPRAARSLRTIVHDILNERITVRADGKQRRISRLEALVLRQVELAAKGNLRALEKLLHLHMTLVPDSEPIAPTGSDSLGETDEAVLQEYARMIIRRTTGSRTPEAGQ